MPIYEYRCDNGHQFEVIQRMTEDAITACEVCDAPVQRVFHPVAVHFKGSGFYTTDYGKKKGAAASSEAGSPSSSNSSDKGESGKGEPKKSESNKSESKQSSASSSSKDD
jgi:putative FmdB family regulatory protein